MDIISYSFESRHDLRASEWKTVIWKLAADPGYISDVLTLKAQPAPQDDPPSTL